MKDTTNIVIVNTGVANVRSVANMLKRIKVTATISDSVDAIANADALILPGVGSFDACIDRLRTTRLIDPLNKKALQDGIPILGLCRGMQIMGNRSEEGELPGLGWIPGELHRLKTESGKERIRVPHMGWNIIEKTQNCVLYDGMGPEPRFYFDHSYYFATTPEHVCGTTWHGIEFAAGIRRANIFGVQFHPEKSHRFGVSLFTNFVAYAQSAKLQPLDSLQALT